jgi:hypothetical protein
VSEPHVATAVIKFNPLYLQRYAPRALLDTILRVYVIEEHKMVTNGFRSIGHDTNVQEFLERSGFRKVFCDLKVAYRPEVGLGVRCLFPLRRLVARMPQVGPVAAVKGLFEQEKIRRSFL